MKLLVVEDNANHRSALVEQLSRDGVFIADAATGADAIRVASRVKPEVVVLDMRLPDSDGSEVARRLRREGACHNSYIIALTANAFPEDRERARTAGCDWFIAKPYAIEDLLTAIKDRARLTEVEPVSAAIEADHAFEKLKACLHDVRACIGECWHALTPAQQGEVAGQLQACSRALGEHTEALPIQQSRHDYSGVRKPAMLLVENDRGQAELLRSLFVNIGYSVTLAADAGTAIAQLSQGTFSVFVVDLRLGADSGLALVKECSALMSPERNVVFMSVAPSAFGPELQQVNAARVYDKNSRRLDDLIRLVREVVPPPANVLVAEEAIEQRGRELLSSVRSLLATNTTDASIDDQIAAACNSYAEFVKQEQSSDANKYLAAADVLIRCFALLDSALLIRSRRQCVFSYWHLRERWMLESRRYMGWSYSRLTGLLTGYGESPWRIAVCLLGVIVTATAMLAGMPEVFQYFVAGQSLQSIPFSERISVAGFIAFGNALLVGTENIWPLNSAGRALFACECTGSVLLLSLYLTTLTARLRVER